jgi:hypothetical protein
MMETPQAREIIREVAKAYGICPLRIVSTCRRSSLPAYYARIEVAKRLRARGYSMYRIGAILNRHHSTVLYYLGKAHRKAAPPRWRRPRIRFLKSVLSISAWEKHGDRCKQVPQDRRDAENAGREIRSRTGATATGASAGQEAQA